jgi:hypothetical protein
MTAIFSQLHRVTAGSQKASTLDLLIKVYRMFLIPNAGNVAQLRNANFFHSEKAAIAEFPLVCFSC